MSAQYTLHFCGFGGQFLLSFLFHTFSSTTSSNDRWIILMSSFVGGNCLLAATVKSRVSPSFLKLSSANQPNGVLAMPGAPLCPSIRPNRVGSSGSLPSIVPSQSSRCSTLRSITLTCLRGVSQVTFLLLFGPSMSIANALTRQGTLQEPLNSAPDF